MLDGEFQALIGTVETDICAHHMCGKCQFQALIGTVETEWTYGTAMQRDRFQALIGTVETSRVAAGSRRGAGFKPS